MFTFFYETADKWQARMVMKNLLKIFVLRNLEKNCLLAFEISICFRFWVNKNNEDAIKKCTGIEIRR